MIPCPQYVLYIHITIHTYHYRQARSRGMALDHRTKIPVRDTWPALGNRQVKTCSRLFDQVLTSIINISYETGLVQVTMKTIMKGRNIDIHDITVSVEKVRKVYILEFVLVRDAMADYLVHACAD